MSGPGRRPGTRTPPTGEQALTESGPQPRLVAGPGDELAASAIADELRNLIGEAQAAVAELATAIADGRQIAVTAADSARGAAYAAGNDEVGRFTSFLNGEMRAAVTKFDGIVNRARQQVIKSLRPRFVQVDSHSGWVTVQFDGELPGEALPPPEHGGRPT